MFPLERLVSFRGHGWAIPVILICALLLPHVSGSVQPGVKIGDWSHYSVSENVTGNKTLVKSYPKQYSAYANTSYVSLNVTNVVGTNVTLTQGFHYLNGSLASSISVVDVSIGVDPSNPPTVIMQNSLPFNSITNGTFFGVSRLVNNLDVSGDSGNSSRHTWDEITGILISELISNTVDSSTSSGTFTFVLSMTSTNLWHYVPPRNPPPATSSPFGLQFAELYVLTGVIGSVAVGVVAFARRRRSRSKRGPRSKRKDSRNPSL